MSAPHTPGRLTADEDGLLLTESGHCLAAVGSWEASQSAAADAQRLAACWNACGGISMDAFDGGWTAKGLSQYAKSLELRLTEAAALLRDVVRPHDEQARQAAKAGEAPKLNPLAGRIHEFLEAAGPLIAFARPLVRPPTPVADALPDTEGGSCD